MIRKPGDDDFREGAAVSAVRVTHKIAVEGSKGVGQGLNRLVMGYLCVIMAFGFAMTLVMATGGLALIPLIGGAIWYWRSRKKTAQAQTAALRQAATGLMEPREEPDWTGAANASDDDAAFPPEERRQGCIEADIGAVTQQVVVLLVLGLLAMLVLGGANSTAGLVVLVIAVMLAVLVASRLFGHRRIIAWDTRTVKVWNLLSDGEMQWSDVTDVSVEKASRFKLGVYFQTGTRQNIVITSGLNRLGGPNTLRVPLRYMNLPQPDLARLLADLLCWRALGNSAGAPRQASPPRARPLPKHDRPEPTPLPDPRDSFDPDAIMARYLREREDTLRAAGRDDDSRPAPSALPRPGSNARPAFGRKST